MTSLSLSFDIFAKKKIVSKLTREFAINKGQGLEQFYTVTCEKLIKMYV